MSFGQLQSIRYAILNFLQDIKVLVSIFVSRDQQYPDGSFKYFPPDRFYKGITDIIEIQLSRTVYWYNF